MPGWSWLFGASTRRESSSKPEPAASNPGYRAHSRLGKNTPVLTFSLGLSLAAGFFVGLFPLAGISSISISDALREESRSGTGGKKSRRVRQLLVTAQVGFAFTLLMGAGLLLASFRLLLHVDPGFNPNVVASASLALPRSRYANDDALRDFMNRA